MISDFVDGELPKRYSSKIELKALAMRFGEINKLNYDDIERLLIEVDRLKSKDKLSDMEILLKALRSLNI